jgi:hypothetical protein
MRFTFGAARPGSRLDAPPDPRHAAMHVADGGREDRDPLIVGVGSPAPPRRAKV